MKQSKILHLIGLLFLSFYMLSCDNDLHITMPEGPAGKSAFEIWVQEVEKGSIDWPKDRVELEHFFLYLKGKDGQNGQDGLSAYELWVKEVEKGINNPHNQGEEWDKSKTDKNDFWYFLTGADGKDGKNGSTPQIGENGNWWIDGEDTGLPSKGANGKDGTKITVSENNTWVIDGTDTGIPLTGADGKDGKEVYIGDNGNWFIDGKDTTIPARGKNGKDGQNGKDGTNGFNGKSAYEVWVVEVMNGLADPHNSGQDWDKSKITLDDFWYYLRGKTGADGQNGQSGKDGSVISIGDNGNWFIDGKDTGKPSQGDKGKDGTTPQIGDNGNWWIDGEDTGKPAIGKDGIDGTDGTDGRTPNIEIGDNGNWFIDGEDTGKPAFGKDGQNGKDGLSAYELWMQEAKTGTLDDPKNPGQKWPQDKTTVQDFWEYLKGKDGLNGTDGSDGTDGQSAYELWKEKVSEGLLNPHDETGGNWPQDKVTIDDFWEYLRGKDGKDGTDGEDGQTIIKGKPNVIAEFFNATLEEYVDVTDGSVLFKVYDDKGDPAPNAEVTDIPGIPGKTYTADANGSFTIPKTDLPQDLSETDRTGACTVKYTKSTGVIVTETSAPNSYVPNRIYVRISVTEVPYLGWDKPQTSYEWEYSTVNVKLLVERRSGLSGNWEALPIGLGSLDQDIIAYELSDSNDPLSYSSLSKKLASAQLDISKPVEIKVNRPTKNVSYLSSSWQDKYLNPWDGNNHYFNVILESYYGESPEANVIVELAPVQLMPLVKNLKGKDPQSLFLSEITGEFDLSNIDYNLFFNKEYVKSGVKYSPTIMSKEEADKVKTLYIVFSKDGNAANNSTNIGTLASPDFKVLVPFYDAGVGFQSRTHLFHGFGWMGNLRNSSGTYYVESDKWHGSELSDIAITIVP